MQKLTKLAVIAILLTASFGVAFADGGATPHKKRATRPTPPRTFNLNTRLVKELLQATVYETDQNKPVMASVYRVAVLIGVNKDGAVVATLVTTLLTDYKLSVIRVMCQSDPGRKQVQFCDSGAPVYRGLDTQKYGTVRFSALYDTLIAQYRVLPPTMTDNLFWLSAAYLGGEEADSLEIRTSNAGGTTRKVQKWVEKPAFAEG